MEFRSFKARKLESLTERETISSFASWKQNLEFHLASCNDFAAFIAPNVEWSSSAALNRGLVDDEDGGKTAVQKAFILEHMIGLVVSYCPETIRIEIQRKCTSLKWIWNRVRRHYGFNKSEVNFLKLATLKFQEGERYEAFFQRIMAHLYDNLLSPDSNLTFDGAVFNTNEEMSPSTERLAVFLWLHFIDERLPMYVSRVYAHDLQSKSLKDMQPIISQNMECLLLELAAQEDIKLSYSSSSNRRSHQRFAPRPSTSANNFRNRKQLNNSKSCVFCKACKKPYTGHDVSTCWALARFNKSEIVDALRVEVDDDEFGLDESVDELQDMQISSGCCVQSSGPVNPNLTKISRVEVMKSPNFICHYNNKPCKVTVDTGAQSNVISLGFVQSSGMPLSTTNQGAKQLDGSRVKTCGEVDVFLNFGKERLRLTALVVESADTDILAGIPFCKRNSIEVSIKDDEIYIKDQILKYGQGPQTTNPRIFKADSVLLRSDSTSVIYPGETINISCSDLFGFDGEVALEPRTDSPSSGSWPQPSFVSVENGVLCIPNRSKDPVSFKKNQHLGNLRRIVSLDLDTADESTVFTTNPSIKLDKAQSTDHNQLFSDRVSVDPDSHLSALERDSFLSVNKKFSSVFDPSISGYNDASGRIRAHITLGSMPPPPKKARVPFYNHSNLALLQEKADELEEMGVLVPPESIGVVACHVSPSFLVKKANGDSRFVTAFNDIAAFCRLPPSKATKINDVLQKIGSFKYLIKTDLTKSFFQIKVGKDSIRYLGTVTPFKGVRVYTRAAMGMPGSSEWLNELMACVVGDLLMAGCVLIIADDLYVGGSTILELLNNWECLLFLMHKNNLKLSASKTVICPRSTTVLGWIWCNGTLSISSHKICPLLATEPPKTCTAMRSFLGAFKDIARGIPRCSSLLSPLENCIKGMSGEGKILWTSELLDYFSEAKKALKSPHSLVLPRKEDQLLITVDASPLNHGLAGTLFVVRNGKKIPAEFFSFKLKSHQVGWLPCEMEALGITASVSHFSPYIKESVHTTQVLTDSRPCVQAWGKLKNGLFSASARVSTFLSTLSAHNVSLCHIKGTLNRISDYGSRNPLVCENGDCQICNFIEDTASSVVFSVTVADVLEGRARMPFLSHSSWKSAQRNDSCLRRAYAHLSAGTRPPPKAKNSKELREILRVASVDSQKGILVVRKEDPFVGSRDLILCPTSIAPGLITALHLSLSHPSKSQLIKVFNRYFFTLGALKITDSVIDHCDVCRALKKTPKEIFVQSSSPPAAHPGQILAADIICRAGQKILVVRDTLTSFTTASFVQSESATDYRDGLIICCLPLKSQLSSIRVDCAPGLNHLRNDMCLQSYGIILDFGRVKNLNKNPVAEKANQELELEILKIDPSGKAISASVLTRAVHVLNTRIRNSGLSSKEMFFRRDQVSGQQLSFNDSSLGSIQSKSRARNHIASAKSKGKGGSKAIVPDVTIGSIVYIKQEGSKFCPRESYIIVDILDSDVAVLQKMDLNKKCFRSKTYEVPLVNLYPCMPSQDKGAFQPDLASTSQGTPSTFMDNYVPSETWDTSSCSSDSSFIDIGLPEVSGPLSTENFHHLTNEQITERSSFIPRRSTRVRHQPNRYNSTGYNPNSSFNAESDMIENWWPNYPRGTWHPNTDQST